MSAIKGYWAVTQDHVDEPPVAQSVSADLAATVETTRSAIRILAVDDDPFIRSLVPIVSENAGYSEVTTVSSGQLALDAIARTEAPYDCLLLDISMPGMDGIELCKTIREIPSYRNTPIVMLTGMRDMKSMDSAFQAGATDYVTKPFDVIELGARLRLVQELIGVDIERTISEVVEKPQATLVADNKIVERFDEQEFGRTESPRRGEGASKLSEPALFRRSSAYTCLGRQDRSRRHYLRQGEICALRPCAKRGCERFGQRFWN